MTTISNRVSLQVIVALVLFLNVGCAAVGVVVSGGGAPPPREPAPHSYPSYRSLNIPPGHLPPPGQCRIWLPGKPPGHQPPPASCESALRDAAPGSWVLYRPSNDSKILEVKEKKAKHPKIEVVVNRYMID
jgi:hypothetical protein